MLDFRRHCNAALYSTGSAASGTVGSQNPFLLYWMGFKSLPIAVQTSVMLFPLFIIFGRLITWVFQTYFETEIIETEEEKRARLLSEHGWADVRETKKARLKAEHHARQAASVSKSKRAISFGDKM
jgi:hypothetical protein